MRLLRAMRLALFVVVGVLLLPTAAMAANANLWVDPNAGTCSRQSSPAAYNDAAACTLQAAYNAALSGDTIRIVGGTYSGDFSISGTKTTLASMVVDSGTMTITGELNISADNVSITGPGVALGLGLGTSCGTSGCTSIPAKNITLDGWKFDRQGTAGKAAGYLASVDGVMIKNSTFMNNIDASLVFLDAGPGSGTGTVNNLKNVTFDHITFHDAMTVTAGVHTECFYGGSGTNVTVRYSHFYNCRTMDLFVTQAKSSTMHHQFWTIENNLFECSINPDFTCHNYALVFRDLSPLHGDIVRNNTTVQDINLPNEGAEPPQSYFYSNAVSGWLECVSTGSVNVTYGYNVTTSQTQPACPGTGNQRVASLGLDSAFRPMAGSAVINAGDPANSTAVDLDDLARVGVPDAGVYEFGASGNVKSGSQGISLLEAAALVTILAAAAAGVTSVRRISAG